MKHWVILKVPKEFPNYPNNHDFAYRDTFQGWLNFLKIPLKIAGFEIISEKMDLELNPTILENFRNLFCKQPNEKKIPTLLAIISPLFIESSNSSTITKNSWFWLSFSNIHFHGFSKSLIAWFKISFPKIFWGIKFETDRNHF